MSVAFQLIESEKDVANFFLESGSGNQIPEPFDFVSYPPPDTIPSASSQPTSSIAEFIPFTYRELPSRRNSLPLALKEGPVVSATDIGDGKGATNDPDVGGGGAKPPRAGRDWGSGLDLGSNGLDGIRWEWVTSTTGYATRIGFGPEWRHSHSGSVVGASSQPITVSSKAQLPISPTVPVSMVPKSTQPAGVEVAQSNNTNTSYLRIMMLPPGAAAPRDPRSRVKWRQLYDAPVPRNSNEASSLRAPSVRSQSVNKRPTIKFDDQEIAHSYSRPRQSQSPAAHQHPQAINGSTLIPDGYPLNQISTGGNGGETPQHHDPSNLVWKSPSKPLLQGVGDVLDSDSDEADESGSYYSAVDEPEMHMPVMVPQTSGQLDLFWKQHEHNSLNSNVNPINFVIKKMLKARRIVHSTYSTSGSSMKVDTDSFVSHFSESAEDFSLESLSTIGDQ
jgi:hypothetical protein